MNNEKLTFWAWFIFVAFVGAILGYFTKNKAPLSKVERIKGLFIGVTTSMFAAYVTFQIAFFYWQNENVSVAIAGVAAWMGADAFLTLEQIITNSFIKKDKHV